MRIAGSRLNQLPARFPPTAGRLSLDTSPVRLPIRNITPWDRLPIHLTSQFARHQDSFTSLQDPLTMLPNRAAFLMLLDGYLQHESSLSLILVDVDQLKNVNDTAGHAAGDRVLQTIAEALLRLADCSEVVSRIGDDEFAIITPRARSVAALKSAMLRYQDEVRTELAFLSAHAGIRVSLGGALFPRQGMSRKSLMQSADIALFEAKRLGGDRSEVFRQSTLKSIQLRHEMRVRASDCLQRAESLQVYYQPKVDIQTGRTVGYEALIRCADQGGQIRGPAWISAAFDDPSLSLAIGERLRRDCFKFTKSLLWMSDQPAKVALNITSWELQTPGWAETFIAEAEAADIPLTALEIEVTESVILDETLNATMNGLELLHDRGVTITLDDFGTGFASLSHLQSCPVDALKIDRSFTRNLPNADAEAIVKAIIGLGQSLHMTVIAEGVERIEQHALLKEWGCPQGQGYFYGHAIPGSIALLDATGKCVA